MNDFITLINDALWSYVLMGVLVLCGVWFTWKTKGVQFRMIGEMIRLLADSATSGTDKLVDKDKGHKHISSFQAFAVSVATRVGTGNLAGVATAIAIGGPGAVFWMWIIALLGSATAFVESTLGQLFKQRHNQSFIGGPAYYIKKGLKKKWMAYLFAVLITVTFGLSYNSIQSNTICGAMKEAFGWNPLVVGVILSATALVIVFGGIHRIANVSSVLVPLMAVGYFLLVVVIIIMNLEHIPHVLRVIVTDAFGIEQGAGGALGVTIMNGVKRGLFSNESGLGSAPIVAAAAQTRNPVRQALVSSSGTFWDTVVICAMTGIVIISSVLHYPDISFSNGAVLTHMAFSKIPVVGTPLLTFGLLTFAFTTILGWSYYGEKAMEYLKGSRWVLPYRIAFVIMVFIGCVMQLDFVWNLADCMNALMALPNLISLLALSGIIVHETRKYLWNGQLDRKEDNTTI